MVKSKADLLKISKDRRKKYAAENKDLKFKKNWYPVVSKPLHFERISKTPKPTHIHKPLTPGQIVILLSGRFRGRRVVYLKKSKKNNVIIVTGPYKLNGVPLKRVNQAYVLPTATKINAGDAGKDITDELFDKDKNERKKVKKDFFEDPATKKARITNERKDAQAAVDTKIIKAVDDVPELKNYLKNRFALKNGDKPHLMKF